MHLVRLALACAAWSVAATAAAHDTWLRPAGEAPLRFHLTSGGAFPAPEHGIEPDRLAQSGARMAGRTAPLKVVTRREDVLVLEAPVGPRLSLAWVALKPRVLDLTEPLVKEYLHEIGEAHTIGPEWARRPTPRRWRETYRKHAKAVLTPAPGGDDGSWREPVGLALEIVPETSPIGLAAGSRLTVRVLKEGQPRANLPVRAARKGGPGRIVRTDAAGRATFTLDAAGPWLIAGTELRESVARPGEWDSDFTTLTFDVRP
jgi:uncharacterized GH25 family protein